MFLRGAAIMRERTIVTHVRYILSNTRQQNQSCLTTQGPVKENVDATTQQVYHTLSLSN